MVEVIDLLSDGEGGEDGVVWEESREAEGAAARRRRRRLRRRRPERDDDDDDGDDDGIIIGIGAREEEGESSKPGGDHGNPNDRDDGDGGDGDPMIDGNDDRKPPSRAASAAIVKNPYVETQQRPTTQPRRRRRRPEEEGGSRAENIENDAAVAGKSTGRRSVAENPYSKKKRRAAEPRRLRQPRKAPSLKDPPGQRELQAGLVFEEDVDHVRHSNRVKHQSTLGKKKPPLAAKSRATGGGDGADSDDENDCCSDAAPPPQSARAYARHQFETRLSHGLPPILYHDRDFVAGDPSTIDGTARGGGGGGKGNKSSDDGDVGGGGGTANPPSIAPPKCRCRPPKPCKLAYYQKDGPNRGRPFHCCQRGRGQGQGQRGGSGGGGGGSGCNHFSWAFTSHVLHWYRFGPRSSGHALLARPDRGYRAEDLVQGRVGDCWFLSALAVVAERGDLIGRLMGTTTMTTVVDVDDSNGGGDDDDNTNNCDNYGAIEVRLFVDGYWKTVIIDDFLPCLIDRKSEEEEEGNIQLALRQSLAEAGIDPRWHGKTTERDNQPTRTTTSSSKFDPRAIADECRRTLDEVSEFLHHDRFGKDPSYRADPGSSFVGRCSRPLRRRVMTSDLAYSKARHDQLWVPFIEKAYAKIHGSYRAISGGHVEEAFLDLTGAPTAVYNFDHHDFDPRRFWGELMTFRRKRLPMGCGTSSSQGGIVGMHAYSILDVREVRNVGVDFFRDKLARGTLGGVSGFTEVDGTVRLLRIRNPHGQGEWKGEFSDKSPVWEKLMANRAVDWKESDGAVDLTAPQSPELERTMVNDGTFWIDYDSFLMGFSNVDVVLAFQGNHAKSFGSSFPLKKSNHRCTRAFELSAVGRQPGEEGPCNNKVEIYVMCIQKTRRGASLGRVDRKKSYKASDVGILVGEYSSIQEDGQVELGAVDGRFFGLNRNGHIRLELDRSDPDTRLVVIPVSFGHPSATDEERSFVVRFVADAPLLVQELSTPPRLNVAMQKFCFDDKMITLGDAGTSRHRGTQGAKTVLMECRTNQSFFYKIVRIDCLAGGGGTVLLYLIVNENFFPPKQRPEDISFSIEINCRGMMCRTASGLVNHEVVSKGKKFEAAWRRFSLDFALEDKSRLLAAVVQGGQDYQMGSIKCRSSLPGQCAKSAANGPMSKYMSSEKQETKASGKRSFASYEEFGIFAAVETPSNILSGECIDLSLASLSAKQFHGKQMEPIEIYDSGGLPGIDHNLDAAIMASIVETQRGPEGRRRVETKKCPFSEDIEKAIALSLVDK